MVVHAGNAVNQMAFEEHEGLLNAKRVSLVSAATIFAVVNTGAAGIATSVLGQGDRFIGLVTNTPAGLHTLAPSPNYIGLVTVGGIGTLTLADPKGYIGLVTIGGIGTLTLSDPKGFIGLTTTVIGSNVTLNASAAAIGIVTIANQPPLATSAAFIGIVTVAGIGTLTLADPKGFIGLTTTVIGNASMVTKNGGTTKTLQIFPIIISTGSAATVYVPTNKFYLTSLILNSNSTVRVNVRSGATYLTGNASMGIELNPGSGWVEIGSPDSPVYLGLAAAAPIVIEKTDYSAVISRVSGKLVLFDE